MIVISTDMVVIEEHSVIVRVTNNCYCDKVILLRALGTRSKVFSVLKKRSKLSSYPIS